LTPARLEVFCFLANILKPYLTFYQSSAPQIPFLCKEMQKCLRQLMALVVKPAILSAVKTPTDYTTLDILLPIGEKENQNLLLASKITIGSAAEAILTQLVREDRITSNEVRVFRKSAQKFTLKILSKMC